MDTSPVPPYPLAAGSAEAIAIGRFEVREKLGEGAFGIVFRARDPQLDRDVAIKVPRSEAKFGPEERERFFREARSAAGLHHPHICPVYEVGTTDDGRDYIVMAYLEGKSLSQVLRSGSRLNERQIATAVRKLALALHEAHLKGVIHRDLKPANIMINRKGEPVIMDFGLARRLNTQDAQVSVSGQIMGTPAYMSPEQARGDSQAVGPPSDQFSLGVIFYELLCGERPFLGTVTEVIGQILLVDPPPPSTIRPGIDPELEAICLKAIAKLPADRYASMKDLAVALQLFLKSRASMSSSPSATTAEPLDDGEPLHTAQLSRLVASVATQFPRFVQLSATLRTRGQTKPATHSRRGLLSVSSAALGILVALVATLFVVMRSQQERVTDATANDEIRISQGPVIAAADNKEKQTSEWIELLNGRDLSGWNMVGAASWTLRGTAVFTEGKKRGFLVHHDLFENFELTGEVYATETGNGGVCFRVISAPADGQLQRGGYEFQVAGSRGDPGGNFTGGLYCGGQRVCKISTPIVEDRTWAKIRLRVENHRLQAWVNERPVFDFVDKDVSFVTGRRLVLQSYGQGGEVGYRDLKVRQITTANHAPVWVPADAVIYNGHYWKLYPEQLTWHQAQNKCKDLGGRLAEVRSVEDNSFLVDLVQRSGCDGIWLGATDEAHHGGWVWNDGTPLEVMFWEAGQPNNFGGAEHYVLLRVSESPGKWWDQPAQSGLGLRKGWKTGYVCQWEPDTP